MIYNNKYLVTCSQARKLNAGRAAPLGVVTQAVDKLSPPATYQLGSDLLYVLRPRDQLDGTSVTRGNSSHSRFPEHNRQVKPCKAI